MRALAYVVSLFMVARCPVEEGLYLHRATITPAYCRTHAGAMLCHVLYCDEITAAHLLVVYDVTGAAQSLALKRQGGVTSHSQKRSCSEKGEGVRRAVDIVESAPTIENWVAACFPGGKVATQTQINDLIKEAADAARSDYGIESAL